MTRQNSTLIEDSKLNLLARILMAYAVTVAAFYMSAMYSVTQTLRAASILTNTSLSYADAYYASFEGKFFFQNLWELPQKFAEIPTIPLSITVFVTLSPILLLAYAGLPTTPMPAAYASVGFSLFMTVVDISTNWVGYQVSAVLALAGEYGWTYQLLTIALTVFSSIADEGALIFAGLGFYYFAVLVHRVSRGRLDFTMFRVSPTAHLQNSIGRVFSDMRHRWLRKTATTARPDATRNSRNSAHRDYFDNQ